MHMKFRVIARSLCHELAGDELILETDDEHEADVCAGLCAICFYHVDVVRICPDCGEELSECYCTG